MRLQAGVAALLYMTTHHQWRETVALTIIYDNTILCETADGGSGIVIYDNQQQTRHRWREAAVVIVIYDNITFHEAANGVSGIVMYDNWQRTRYRWRKATVAECHI